MTRYCPLTEAMQAEIAEQDNKIIADKANCLAICEMCIETLKEKRNIKNIEFA